MSNTVLKSLIPLLVVLGEFAGAEEPLPLVPRSPIALERWARSEIQFYEKLRSSMLIPAEGVDTVSVSKLVRSYIKDYLSSNTNLRGFKNGTMEQKVRAITSNPLASFLMIRRLVRELSPLRRSLKKPDPRKFFPSSWLTNRDLEDVILSILRLSHYYNIDVKKIAAGEFLGVKTGVKLTSRHCYEIGTFNMSSTQFIAATIMFLELALQRSKLDREVDSQMVQEALYDRIILHDESLFQDEGTSMFFSYILSHVIQDIGPFYIFVVRTANELYIEDFGRSRDPEYDYFNFQDLCRKGNSQTPIEKKSLFCWYERSLNSYFSINPLKVELLSQSPNLFQMYDLIGDKNIRLLKEMTSQYLEDSLVEVPEGKVPNTGRTSVSAWIDDWEYDELQGVVKTMEFVTGLNVRAPTASESIHVAAYTFSGFYDHHHDMLNFADDERLGTFMYYLTEPELGGFTAFVQLGVAARPIKGSAVFWYNIFRDGGKDLAVSHGACPIILGQKWITTKWIYNNDQFLQRKCSLSLGGTQRFSIFSPKYLRSLRGSSISK